MPMREAGCVSDVLDVLISYNVSPLALILGLLGSSPETGGQCTVPLGRLLDALEQEPMHYEALFHWARARVTETCRAEIASLSRKDSGLHFDTMHMNETQLEDFEISQLARQMQDKAPTCWSLQRALLAADETLTARRQRLRDQRQERRRRREKRRVEQATDEPMDIDTSEAVTGEAFDDEEQYWVDVDEALEGTTPVVPERSGDGEAARPHDIVEQSPPELTDEEREYWAQIEGISAEDGEDGDDGAVDELDAEEIIERDELAITLKSVVCMSIALQNTNIRCNTLQSILGIYLHACNAAESVVNLLSHVGISISQSSIHNSVSNLSKESTRGLSELGQSLLTEYAFDNFDMEVKHLVPTVEKPQDALLHLTSGTLIRLEHGVTKEDLCCSDELWRKSPLNPVNHAVPKGIDWQKLINIHPETRHTSGLTRRQRFNRWMFLSDLVQHGPEYFRQFALQLGEPEVVDAIPPVKSKQVPAQAMDINQSSVAGNRDAITQLFRQGGVGDANETPGVTDMGNHVTLFAGDLSTSEQVQSLQASRAVETTRFRRLQSVVFMMGLFHLQMACADAIWKAFIQPRNARYDETSLLRLVAEIRPRETGKISTKPGFRRMHEVIRHVGTVSRLDCWRTEISRRYPDVDSLEAWAERKPSWAALEEIADQLIRSFVMDKRFSRQRHTRPVELRDVQLENTLLRDTYFLLYEEMAWALREGDFGRVETCFPPWIFIFRGCGKHKYATQMTKFLHDLHFVYPAGLRRAIRLNILCNPTGKKHHFRAIDWWVEHNNLYIKRIYGGKYSNFTKRHILKQSALIGVFKNVRISVDKMFSLPQRTTQHSTPKMKRTMRKLAEYMKKTRVHTHVPRRTHKYEVPDVMELGLSKMLTGEVGDVGNDGDEGDVLVDGEGGDLDV